MRTLTSTLLAAQREATGAPHVEVETLDNLAGAPRPTLTRLYTGSEQDFYHDATCPGDGSLVRARVTSPSGGLYVQRVVNPGPTSDFSSWTYLHGVSNASGISLVSRGANVYLFYVNSSRRNLFVKESTDYGATWNTSKHVLYPDLSGIRWLAAAISDQNALFLFYASIYHAVYGSRKDPSSGSSWLTPSLWPHSPASITGMSSVYDKGWHLILTGTESTTNDAKVWTCVYGEDGDQPYATWSALSEVSAAKADSRTTFHFPSIAKADVFRAFCVEKSTGSPPFQRPVRFHTLPGSGMVDTLWREPVPFDYSSAYGVSLATTEDDLWVSSPSGVWGGPLTDTALDLTGDVLDLALDERPEGGTAVLTLRNDDGRYNSIGSGAYASLRKGSEVRVSPGYATSAGREVSPGPTYWIESWEYRSSAGKSYLVVFAHNAWRLLETWGATRQYTWDKGASSVADIMEFVLARVGLRFDATQAGSDAKTLKPAFTMHPGESGADAVRRLLDRLPDALMFRGSLGHLIHLQPSDARDYSYGAGHPVLQGRYASRAQAHNRVQAFGSAHMAEAFAWTEVGDLSDRLLQIHDLNLDTAQKALDRARAALREQLLGALDGEIVVPPNLGQEMYDVIEITDDRAGLSADKRRVLGLRLHYSRGPKPEYRHTILLGGV